MSDFFDKEDIVETSNASESSMFDDADVVEEVSMREPASTPEEMSQLEAGLRGAAQGLTFDFGDEIAGAALAAKETAFGDAKLKDLLDTYKQQRDEQRRQMEQASEEYPSTYLASDIGAGILPALATGGASALASLGKTGVKQGVKAAAKEVAKDQSIKQLAKIGAKQGAATGLGMTEDITDVPQVLGDVAAGTTIGGVVGGTLPAVGKKAKDTVKGLAKALASFSGVDDIASVAYEAGKRNIKADDKGIAEAVKQGARRNVDKLATKFSDLGKQRESIMRQAESLGLTLDADTPVRQVYDQVTEIMNREGFPRSKKKEYKEIQDNLQDILGYTPEKKFTQKLDRANTSMEGKRAVDALKMGDKGYQLAKTFDVDTSAKQLTGSNKNLKVKGTKDVYINEDGDIKTKITAKSVPEEAMDVQRLANLTPSQLKVEMENIAELAEFGKPDATASMKKARSLYHELKKVMDKGLGDKKSEYSKINKKYTDLYEALGYNIKDAPIEQADSKAFREQGLKMAKFLETSTTSQEKLNFFERLESAGPEFKDVIEDLKFLDTLSTLNPEINPYVSGSGVGLTNLGKLESVTARVANFLGGTNSQKLINAMTPSEKTKLATKLVNSSMRNQIVKSSEENEISRMVKDMVTNGKSPKTVSKKLNSMDASDIGNLVQSFEQRGNKSFSSSLKRLQNADSEQERAAQESVLTQQPAFRALMRRLEEDKKSKK